ncbi:hypothetical protein ZIOFF_065581 [Zingiber officinale]|uniref:AB hydrolase-1 domain-containing protein n=1 Tax=Zingiber officinale TaxID=94328 RepID=A0A8J5KBJ2_ZINOF|nr:hypothetical protein ZIOFF_065581 [Zingiber officinale]
MKEQVPGSSQCYDQSGVDQVVDCQQQMERKTALEAEIRLGFEREEDDLMVVDKLLVRTICLGGFAALITAAESAQLVRGIVLLNSAGQFSNANTKQSKENGSETALQKLLVNPVKEALQRIFLGFLFWQAKQPSRIEKVYINTSNVDNYLVESITRPAGDPNAGEVYYRLMTRFMSNQSKYTLDSVLSELSCPLLLIWGDLDPWVGPAKAVRIKDFYPNTTIVNLKAGHCPHDEVPELVNIALLDWLSSLEPVAGPQASA